MSTYVIEKFETKEWSPGKVMGKADLMGEDGQLIEDVAIWSTFPSFASLKKGDAVTGSIEVTKKGKYTNRVLNPSIKTAYAYGGGSQRSKDISHAMDKKEESIRISSTARDATILTAEWMRRAEIFPNHDDVQAHWLELRSWLWNHWEHDPTKEKPF